MTATHPYIREIAKLGKELPFTGKPVKIEENKSGTSGGNVGLAVLANHMLAFEKETDNPDAATFAGQFAAMLAAMAEMSLKG